MTFTLLPAVDVADGQAVRPVRGEVSGAVTDGEPRDVALAWQADGAEWIHLVDLDAAFGTGSNADLLASVIGELDVPVELSGGITNDGALQQALATGCERIVVGTSALADRAWCERVIGEHGELIAMGLDVRIAEGPDESLDHRLAARGSTDDVGDLWETLGWLDAAGASRYVVTDVSRDGMLSGPNMDLYRAVSEATAVPVITSGGVAEIEDLVTLATAASAGVNLEGAIVGKALYARRFTLPEALDAVRV